MRGLSNHEHPAAGLLNGAQQALPAAARRRRPRRPAVKSQVQRRLVAGEIEELVHTYEAGATLLALAERFQLSRATVMAHVRRSGAESRYNRLACRVDEARRLYELGWSLARVAAHFDVSPGTVLNAFNSAGVATRPVGTNQWSSGP